MSKLLYNIVYSLKREQINRRERRKTGSSRRRWYIEEMKFKKIIKCFSKSCCSLDLITESAVHPCFVHFTILKKMFALSLFSYSYLSDTHLILTEVFCGSNSDINHISGLESQSGYRIEMHSIYMHRASLQGHAVLHPFSLCA